MTAELNANRINLVFLEKFRKLVFQTNNHR